MSEQAPWDITKQPMMAYIREDECIGCTKCIPDCPTDAIMGAAKVMHTVITDVCTGCELCVPTCPVDCIDIIPVEPRTQQQTILLDSEWQKRFDAHNKRSQRNETEKKDSYDKAVFQNEMDSVEARKKYIQAALERSKGKK